MSESNNAFPLIANILLVDDDLPATNALVRGLKRQGAEYCFHIAETSEKALSLAQSYEPEAAVVDLELDPAQGPSSGLALIGELMQVLPTVRILVLTGHGTEEMGIKALQMGAASFLEKPADLVHLLALLRDAVSFARLKRQYLTLCDTPEQLSRASGLTTRSSRMIPVLEAVAYAASNNQPVLLTGETGVGKGLIARAIHQASARSSGPFIRLQPSFGGHDLVASELFGHQKGSFTGASEHRKGLLEEAHRGTLFIDEVGELPHETQVMLLEVVQEKVFRRIGANDEIRSDFRLLAATNRPVDELRQKKLLRDDFYHRVAHFTIDIPPLRERAEDIQDLANLFIAALVDRENLAVQGLTPDAIQRLSSFHWPGNVRELQAIVEGGAYRANFHQRHFVEAADLTISKTGFSPANSPLSFKERVCQYELQLIRDALKKHNGNQTKAAESLQLDRSTLRRIIKRDKK